MMIRTLRKWRWLCWQLLVILSLSATAIVLVTVGAQVGPGAWESGRLESARDLGRKDGIEGLRGKAGRDGDSARILGGNESPANNSVTPFGDEDSEMVARGKAQQARMDAFCAKYGQFHPSPVLGNQSRDDLYRHLITDNKEQVIYCFVEKSGCTNMKRLMFVNMRLLPLETVKWKWVENKYLEKALKRSNFAQKDFTRNSRLQCLKSYFKFMVVRHPLERLVSGYRNKIEPPMNSDSVQNRLIFATQKEILKKYRPQELKRWLASNMSYSLTVSFTEFVQYLVTKDNRNINPHFRPMINTCHPCEIKYDFYANFRSLGQDTAYIIRRIHAQPEYYLNESVHSNATQTKNFLGRYYSQLPESLRYRLFEHWRTELDFYYHLYPDEKNSHTALLGVGVSL